MVQGVLVADNCIINVNPATGEVISRVPCSTAEELEDKLQKSKVAFESWSLMPSTERIQLLRNGLIKLNEHHDPLVQLIVQEMGKPKAEAKEEMEGAANKGEFMDILLKAQEPERYGQSLVVRQALGVVVILSPWNFPVDEILLLALPALGAGNTVIVKPSEVTPECGALTVSCLASALPQDVIQVAQGDGSVGAHLVAHPSVDMVAMTGSSATGKKILATASQSLKRVVLELGGKDPMVVFDDADLDKAAKDAVDFSLCNTGQVCCSVERVFVAESILEVFEEKVLQYARTFKVGNGMDPAVKVGPLVSSIQLNHVQAQVMSAVEDGADLMYQSDIPEAAAGTSFFPVTVLSKVTPDMDICRSETFGPVVCISAFDGSEASGIRLANDTQYGLAGSVYTTNAEKARRVAHSMNCGQVGINCYAISNMNVACPW
jgi:acyl-CoA reductase-like NAD-dependent aldehyde dehydrogenase